MKIALIDEDWFSAFVLSADQHQHTAYRYSVLLNEAHKRCPLVGFTERTTL